MTTTAAQPRLRMFAGPDGAGKSTMQAALKPYWLGTYLNPHDIEARWRIDGRLCLLDFHVISSQQEITDYLQHARLPDTAALLTQLDQLQLRDLQVLTLPPALVNAAWANATADFLRHKLLQSRSSFSLESRLATADEPAFLQQAKDNGFCNYLYFVATADPQINLARRAHDISMGQGMARPGMTAQVRQQEQIVQGHQRSLDLLAGALQHCQRSYIFDNSGNQPMWLAEIQATANGHLLEMKTSQMPAWFKTYVLDRFEVVAL